jgi:DNA-directed RNA polymerase, sigma subunit (sigma70/sigma32)
MLSLNKKGKGSLFTWVFSVFLDINSFALKGTLGAEVKQMSMDARGGEEESGPMLDVLENDAEEPTESGLVFNDSLKVETKRALSTLTPREREVSVMSLGIGFDNPYTLEEIGEVMGITRERVRKIREKAPQK